MTLYLESESAGREALLESLEPCLWSLELRRGDIFSNRLGVHHALSEGVAQLPHVRARRLDYGLDAVHDPAHVVRHTRHHLRGGDERLYVCHSSTV